MAYTDIDKSDDYFNTKLYTGNGIGSSRSLTGVGFQPDFVWHKTRSSSGNHQLYDVVRGAGEVIQSDNNNAEVTNLADGYLSSFDSDGFTMTDGASSDYYSNDSGKTYVTWNWLADNTSGSSNTDGSITSTVSANTTSGFSIVSWTGTGTNPSTIGHGLGTAPSCIILKNRDASGGSGDWYVGHDGIGWTDRLKLNTTAGTAASSTLWNNTAPTSSVFTISSALNFSGDNTIAYCFAEKKGFSKFGSYTSVSSHDANFVYLGFKPAMIIFKNYSYAPGTDWHILDRTRYTFNSVNEAVLEPNTNDAESYTTFGEVDFLSNGFKIRNNNAISGGGYDIIYMAFAENPLVTSTGIPALAR